MKTNLLNKIRDHASCILHPALISHPASCILHRASFLLLMLVTLSVGQVWGANETYNINDAVAITSSIDYGTGTSTDKNTKKYMYKFGNTYWGRNGSDLAITTNQGIASGSATVILFKLNTPAKIGFTFYATKSGTARTVDAQIYAVPNLLVTKLLGGNSDSKYFQLNSIADDGYVCTQKTSYAQLSINASAGATTGSFDKVTLPAGWYGLCITAVSSGSNTFIKSLDYESAPSCSWNINYITNGKKDSEGDKVWSENNCFTQVGSTNEWRLEDFVMPNLRGQFWVGPGLFKNTDGGHSAIADLTTIKICQHDLGLPTNTYSPMEGGVGTLVIWSNSGDNNYAVRFLPTYQITYDNDGDSNWESYPFAWVSDHEYKTDILQIPSGYATKEFYVGCKKENGTTSYVMWENGGGNDEKSKTKKMNTMGGLTSGDMTGKYGKFTIYDNSTDQNWYCSFAEYYVVELYDQDVKFGETQSSPASAAGKIVFTAPSARTGYTFGGWTRAEGDPYTVTSTMPDWTNYGMWKSYERFNAVWTANNYTITLNDQSATTAGTASVTATYDANTNLTSAITKPAKTGYTFGGYYTEEGGSGTQVIGADGNFKASVSGYTDASKNWIKAENVTLYAKWTANQYTLTFDSKGGSAVASQTIDYNGHPAAVTAPTKSGFTFDGWSETDGGSVVADITTLIITADKTLYAKWTVDSRKKILYVTTQTGSTLSADKLYTSLNGNANYNVTVASSIADGYATTYDLIVLHESLTGSAAASGNLKAVREANVPVLNTKAYFYNSDRWNWGTPDAGTTQHTMALNTDYSNISSHPIFAGVTISSNNITVTSGSIEDSKNFQSITAFTSGKEGYTLAKNTDNECIIHELTPAQRGGAAATGGTAKYMMISLYAKNFDLLTDNGLKLFNNAVTYLLGNSQWEPAAPVCENPANPVISCSNNSVTISCTTDGATIYYTTDGSTPTSSSTAYTAAVAITETKTFKAIAIKDACESEVTSQECTYVAPTPGECEEIFHAALTSATAATYTGSEADNANCQINLGDADSGKSGYKFKGNGKYVKIALLNNFQAGDKISFEISAAASQGAMTISTASDGSGVVVAAGDATTSELTLPAGSYGKILYVARTSSQTYNAHITAISVCRPTACDKSEATLTWTTAPADGTVGDADVTLAVNKGSSTGAVTYTSSNTSVATIVDGTKLHYVAAGTATITANLAGDDTYCPKSIEQSITVTGAVGVLTALESGTLYKPGDMLPSGKSITSSEQYVSGLSANGRFFIIGNGSLGNNPGGSPAIKTSTEVTYGDCTSNEYLYFKDAAQLTDKLPTDRAIKFVIPSAGTLKIYGNNNIKLIKEGAASPTDVTLKDVHVCELDVTAGTYYLYAANSSRNIVGLKFITAGPACTTPVLPELVDASVCLGEDMAAAWDATPINASTIATASENITYSWKKGGVEVATTATYQVTSAVAASAGEYTVTVYVSADGKSTVHAEKTVSLTVNSGVSLTTSPTSQTVVVGNEATLSVVATGATAYLWKQCATEDGSYTNATGTNNAASYSVTPAATGVTYYKCVITGACGDPVTTSAVTVTATNQTYTVTYDANDGTGTMTAAREYEAGETVTIKTNAFTAPSGKEFAGWVVKDASNADVTVTDGKFTMPAKNVTIKAQWQTKAATGCNTMVIYQGLTSGATGATSGSESNSGATWAVTNGSSTYETVDYTYDGVNYKRGWKIFGGASSASDRFVEIVIPENYTGTFKLVGYITSTGRSAFISTTKTGSLNQSIAYITPASTKTIVGATSAAMAAGTYYFCVTNAFQITELSVDVCPVAACTAPTINSVEASETTVCSGTNVTLSASATANAGGALSYQWYKSDNTTAGAAGAEIVVTPDETTTYYCKVTDANCSVASKSSTVTVTVNAATAITTQPTSTNVGVGEEASLTVVATGSHLSYQWQECATVDGEYANVSALVTSSKSANLLITPSVTGTVYYRCVVSGDCGDVTSSAVSIEAGSATPTVTWGAAETVYQGQKISVSVTTNTDADFDEDALEISGDVDNIVKTKNGKTITATMTVNTNADGTIDLTFNTAAGTSYGATVNAQKSITVSGECPAGLSGVVYTATMATNETANATGGAVTVNNKLSSGSTATRGSNKYYKMDSSSKLTLTPEGGFRVGDVLTIDVTSSGGNDDGVIIKNAGGTQLADLHEKLSSSKNTLLTYTFTTATNYITLVRHSSNCYFYGATVTRAGSPTELAWNDGETSDGETVNVAPGAANFTIAAVSSNSPGAISYSSSNTAVATVNATTGEVDPKAVGKTTITATIATNGCYTTKNITYILNVAADCTPPTITTQPKSAEYTVGDDATALTVAASAGSYQWYINGSNNNTSGSPIGGATSESYTPIITEKGTTYYYCVVTDGYCQTASDVATITVNPGPCALAAPKVIVFSTEGGACWTSITLKAVAQDETDLEGGTFQWYDDGEAIAVGGTGATLTVTQVGTYYVEYTKDACTQESSNKAYVESKEPQVEKLAPFQYYHAGKDDYSDQMNDRHLFTYKSASTTAPTFTATKNGDAYEWSNLENAVSIVDGANGVDTVMLSLNDLAGCDFVAGDEVEITITPLTACGEPSAEHRASTTIKVVDSKPTLAFIVSGADGEGTKTKSKLKLNGDFLTGYNKADLKVQTAQTTVSEAELPLYTELKKHYNVVPVNGYAQFSKWNYEPFDLVFLTDFVKTDGSSDKAAAKKKVDDLAGIVDFRPMFSTKSFMSGISNWEKFGFTAQPQVPKKTQKWMNIVCYAHPMFEQFLEQDDIVKEDQGEGNYEVVFTMLSRGGFDHGSKNEYPNGKGIQGFKLSDVSAFVNIATTHYNAEAEIDPETKTCHPTSIGADDELLIASCERQKNIEARMIMLSVNADATSFLTDEGINVIVLSLNYLLETDPIKVTDCSVTFLGTVDDDWNKAANWNCDKVPAEKNNVRIAAPCVVKGGTNAHAASVKILKNCTYAGSAGVKNGSLIIEPTGALSITGVISRVEDNEFLTLLPTHVGDVTIQSSASGNGALIHGDEDGMIQATVEFYSKATGTDNGDGSVSDAVWQWMTTPLTASQSAAEMYYHAWMFMYSNSAQDWQPQVTDYDPVRPFVGYSITQGAPTTYSLRGTLAPTSDQTISLYSGANLIGNSWTAPIIIDQFKAADFGSGAEATIFLFNTGLDVNGDGAVNTTGDAGTYVSMPIGSASSMGSQFAVIPSMQAFQVKASGSSKITLHYDQLVRTNAVNIQPMRAPSRESAANNELHNGIDERLRISVSGARYSDFLYLFRHPETTDGFDNGWDGEKMYSDNYDIPVLYVENAAGDWQVSTQPVLNGTTFGFYKGEDTQYIIRFDDYIGDEELWLYDATTGIFTAVETGNTYSFISTTVSDAPERRFVLTNYNPNAPQEPGIATGVDDVSPTDGGPRKLILDDKLYILNNGRLYDATGRLAY